MKSWFTARAAQSDGEAEILIYDEIGKFGVSSESFYRGLRALGSVSHINVRINSPGGDPFAAIAINNMLARHKASVTVTVDGIAASAGSLIVMAGDAVVMPGNTLLMIHDPFGGVVGTSKKMREFAAALDKTKETMISVYEAKSGMDRDEIARLMANETWLTAEEAVEMGFADSVIEPMKIAAHFDLTKFKNAPRAMRPAATEAADAAPTRQEEISDMTVTPENGAAEVETAVTEPATIEAAPAVQESETAAQIEARIRAQTADIIAACALVGKPEKAGDFIAKGKSLSEVVAALQTERATTTPAEVSARKPQTEKAPAVIDTTAIYADWNRARARA